MNVVALDISRGQFALTTLFHMLWPLLTIGLSLLMVVMEILWLRRKEELYYRHVRFWSRIFIIVFGIGVASGIPLEFQFGTNWSRFSAASGDLFGNILAFEGAMSFALEAAFLALFVFGWNRVSRGMHLFSAIMVAFGASLSAFWILSANSWMQTPAGVRLEGSKIVIVDYLRAVFNPDLPIAFTHIWVAAVETTAFFVAGISAFYVFKRRHVQFFLKSFKIVLIVGIVVAPLQIFLGDSSGVTVVRHQPAKAAAMEAWWQTNPPGTSAPWAVVAIPDKAEQKNIFSIEVPYLLSLLAARHLKGQVTGLRSFPVEDQPPVAIPFYSFRLMVLLGFFMLGMVIWALVLWGRRRLTEGLAPTRRIFLVFWIVSMPAGFLATECGWALRENGRQPWIIYNLLRTADGVSPIGPVTAGISLLAFAGVYLILLGLFIYFTLRILRKGPDLTSPLPSYRSAPAPEGR
jgi:cytochrome d ubiquinol oxidase subunit I